MPPFPKQNTASRLVGKVGRSGSGSTGPRRKGEEHTGKGLLACFFACDLARRGAVRTRGR
eukprot:scaffold127308_cov36-Tisochrysis_lutea.AAC.1